MPPLAEVLKFMKKYMERKNLSIFLLISICLIGSGFVMIPHCQQKKKLVVEIEEDSLKINDYVFHKQRHLLATELKRVIDSRIVRKKNLPESKYIYTAPAYCIKFIPLRQDPDIIFITSFHFTEYHSGCKKASKRSVNFNLDLLGVTLNESVSYDSIINLPKLKKYVSSNEKWDINLSNNFWSIRLHFLPNKKLSAVDIFW